uniref:Potassium channel domain-containing protein n=1 Tax=Electrophorus electricus TaxID=8005 RepID=A0A4W4FF68_ELEEL
MRTQDVRTLALILCVLVYLFVGAAVFDVLESDSESFRNKVLEEKIVEMKRKFGFADEDYNEIESAVLLSKPHRAGRQWTFAGSLYFAITVITTIGYGHCTPRTDSGKVFCMCYAVLGIPLTLVMFQSVGERMNTLARYLMRGSCRCVDLRGTGVSVGSMVSVGFLTCLSTLCMGAVVFSYFEGWGYFHACYFCFVTSCTNLITPLCIQGPGSKRRAKPHLPPGSHLCSLRPWMCYGPPACDSLSLASSQSEFPGCHSNPVFYSSVSYRVEGTSYCGSGCSSALGSPTGLLIPDQYSSCRRRKSL